jgi:hypothetical protein
MKNGEDLSFAQPRWHGQPKGPFHPRKETKRRRRREEKRKKEKEEKQSTATHQQRTRRRGKDNEGNTMPSHLLSVSWAKST